MAKLASAYGGKSFDEAVSFFRDKISMPSEHWDDLWKGQHAKGFMVAGATKADLVADLRNAVDKAIAKGTTLAEFRKDFSSIVEKHGWAYKGGKNWRTRIIYKTNLRTAYHAGRYKQMKDPDVTALRPYWQYRHGRSVNPREQHLGWDGMVLPHDDPIWDIIYPPNGWGCSCSVRTLSKRELNRMGKTEPDKAPELEYREWTDRDGKTHQVPKGIDPGWDYNVGKAQERSYKILADKFETLPQDIAKTWHKECMAGPVFQRFFDGKIKGELPVAVLSESEKQALGTNTQTVWLSRTTLAEHKIKHPDIGIDDYRLIPELLESGEVYQQGDNRLVYLMKKNRLYRAALKRTKDGRENYYLTLFETTEEKAQKEVREKYRRVR